MENKEKKKLIQQVMNSELTETDEKILKIQKILSLLGYQWREIIYNDKLLNGECYLEICKSSKDPSYFSEGRGDAGWGRFSRKRCWESVFEWIKCN
jgi:hypothetical protein